MKTPAFFTMPWDTVVFLTITTAGFGFTLQRLHQPLVETPLPMAEALAQNASPPLAQNASPPLAEKVGRQPLDLGCLDDSLGHPQVAVSEGSVRIKGRLCQLSKKSINTLQGIRVRNLTNGYEGTIFLHGRDNAFVSDYIILSSGRNEVQVEWRQNRDSPPANYIAEVFEK